MNAPLFLLAIALTAGANGEVPRFSKDVAPILVKRCIGCHDDRKSQSGLNMATFAGLKRGGKVSGAEILVPGNPDASGLVESIRPDAEPRMPYKQPALSGEEIATIERWVKEGARFDGPSETATTLRSLVDPLAGLAKVPLRTAAVEPVRSLEFAPDGKSLAAGVGRDVLLLDAADGKTLATLGDHPGPVTRILFTPDGSRLIAVGGRPGEFGSVRIWDVAGRKVVHDLRGHSDAILAADLSGDGSMLATGSYDKLVKLWNLKPEPGELRTLKEHTDAVHGVAFSPDGRSVASASGDRTVKVWDVANGTKRFTLPDSTAEVYAVIFGRDGKSILAAGVDRSIRVWELNETGGRLTRAIFGHAGPVIRMVAAADRSTLASAGEDRTVKLWDVAADSPRVVFDGQSDWPLGLALSRDGALVAIGRYDGSIDVLDAKAGTKKATLRRPGGLAGKPRLVGNPTLNPLLPRGFIRGAKARLTLGGNGVGESPSIVILGDGISARILPREKPDPNAVDVELAVAADAPVGVSSLSVRTVLGMTPGQPILVTPEPEAAEREPNDRREAATPITLPATIVGSIEKPGDVDLYRVHGEAGQDLVFELYGKSLGSPLTPRLQIESLDGKALASAAETSLRNTIRLVYRVAQAGDFVLRVEDQDFGGSGGHVYRIRVGDIPVIEGVSPLATVGGRESVFHFRGANLGEVKPTPSVRKESAGSVVSIAPASLSLLDPANLPRAVVVDGEQSTESDAADKHPAVVASPGGVGGVIRQPGDVDVYRFEAKKGHRLILETFAQRLGTEADTAIEVVDAEGRPMPRAVLRLVEETNVAFRDHPSMGRNIRLTQWDRFAANDFVLIGRELTRIDELPRNPDDDAIMWGTGTARGGGERIGFLDTTPEHHPYNQPIFKVEIHPVGATFPVSSRAPVTLTYRNDDGGPGYGKDSRIVFDPPADGFYFVRVEDVRGLGGPDHRYQLVIRTPKPDFRLTVNTANPNVPRGGTALVQVEATRLDGFDGPIDLAVEGLPPGITATTSRIEPGAYATSILLAADRNAPADTPATWTIRSTAFVDNAGRTPIVHDLDPGGPRSGYISVRPEAPLRVTASSDRVKIKPGQTMELVLKVDRVEGFSGRVPIEVRNLPRGVRVLNIGLNGVLVTPEQTERAITIFAEPWALPQHGRPFFAVATCEATGTEHSSAPIRLEIEALGSEARAHAPAVH